jgi:DNA phosphorothioation-associated putative methyltransferase
VEVGAPGRASVAFGDGVLTGINTFQKYFSQGELKAYLEESLGVEAVPAEPGIFYLFRDETARQQFLANRYRRRPAAPRKRASEIRFEEHRELLEQLMAVVAEIGRLPEADEFPPAAQVATEFGSLKRAFALVRRVTGEEEWETVRQRRTEDLLVYPALARFRRRPALGQLPPSLQRDMRAFFGTYTKACGRADELLFQAGDPAAIDEACKRSPVGKLLPDDLYVHRSGLDSDRSTGRWLVGTCRCTPNTTARYWRSPCEASRCWKRLPESPRCSGHASKPLSRARGRTGAGRRGRASGPTSRAKDRCRS